MAMNIGGISPGNVRGEQQTNSEQLKIDQQAALQARRLAESAARKQAEEQQQQEERERAVEPPTHFVMSETDMKELLILMGSRGNSQTVEKMVEGVKRLKEQNDSRA